MFDFGFTEVLVAAVIGLIVVGPERLPKVARTLGLWFGKMQRYVADLKDDINRHAEIEEFNQIKASVEDTARDIEDSVSTNVNFIQDQVKQVGQATSADKKVTKKEESKKSSDTPEDLAAAPGNKPAKAEKFSQNDDPVPGGKVTPDNHSHKKPTED